MSLNLSYNEIKREPVEAGNHIARCIQVIDLGTQPEKAFETGEDQLNHKIRITWEIPNEIIEWTDKETGEAKSRCQVISQEFKASLHEKSKLRKTLASWRGRDFTPEELNGFELTKLLEKACFLNIVHTKKDDNKYANISAVTPLAKGMTCPAQITPSIYFDIDQIDWDVYNSLPSFLQDKIQKSVEFNTKKDSETNIDLELQNELEDIDLEDIDLPM